MEALFIIGIIAFCIWLFRGTKRAYREEKTATLYDAVTDSLVKLLRSSTPTGLSSLSDKEILTIAQGTMRAFQTAAEQKGERIPGSYLLNIARFFVYLYETSGKDFFISHLEYELDRYKRLGLREDYKKDMLQS